MQLEPTLVASFSRCGLEPCRCSHPLTRLARHKTFELDGASFNEGHREFDRRFRMTPCQIIHHLVDLATVVIGRGLKKFRHVSTLKFSLTNPISYDLSPI